LVEVDELEILKKLEINSSQTRNLSSYYNKHRSSWTQLSPCHCCQWVPHPTPDCWK